MRRLEVVNKTKILLIIVILALVAVFIKSASVGAEVATLPPYMTMNSSDRAISDESYYALKECITYDLLTDGINSDQIEGANVKSGTWFTSDKVIGTGRMVGSIDNAIGYFMLNPADANMKCGDSGPWITAVYTSPTGWNYGDMVTALCTTTGAQRWDQPRDRGCLSNTGLFTGAADHAHGLTTNALSDNVFTSAIKNKIYGGAEPSAIRSNGSEKSKATQYVEDRRVLFTGCIGDPAPAKVSSGESANYLYNVTFVNGVGQSEPDMFYAGGTYGKSKTTKVTYLSGATGGNVTKTCGELETLVNANSTSYKNVSLELAALGQTNEPGIVPNGTGTGGGAAGTTQPTCGSTVTGIGWLVCPITTAIVGLNDAIWDITSGLLTVNPLSQSDAVYNAWNAIRSIANVLFVIFFLIIIFSQLTGAGITNYGIKKLLPRLIICAILVNVSFVIIQIAVDLSNIAGAGLINLLNAISPGSLPTWGNLLGVISGAGALTVVGLGIAAIAPASAFLLLMPIAVMGILALITGLLTLIFRQAVIPVLAIIAPLAFVAYLLPNTEKWFKKWLDLLLPMLLLYPIAALVFGGAKFAAGVIVTGHKDEFFANLIGMIVLSAPLFSLPFLARQGGSILKTVQGGLSKLAENARAPLKNFAKDRAEAAQLNYENKRPSTALGGLAGFNRRNAVQRRYNNKMRQDRKELNTAQIENRMNENTTGRMKDNLPPEFNSAEGAHEDAARLTVRGMAARKKEVLKDKESIDNEIGNESGRRYSGQEATDRLARSKDDSKVVENAAGIRQGLDPRHREIKKQVANLDTALKNQTSDIAHEAKNSVTDDGAGGTLDGQALATQSVANERIAKSDSAEATTRYNDSNDATYLAVRDAGVVADTNLKTSEDAQTQLVTEAKSGSDKGRAAALAGGMGAATITSLAAGQRTQDNAANATRQAQDATKDEYEKAVAPSHYEDTPALDLDGNPIMVKTTDKTTGVTTMAPKMIHRKIFDVSADTIAAAGIGSTNQVQAYEVSEGNKRLDQLGVAERVLREESGTVADKINIAAPQLAQLITGPDADTDDGAIAGSSLGGTLTNTGGQGLKQGRRALAKAPSGSTSKALEAARSQIQKAGAKGKAAALDRFGVDDEHHSIGELMRDRKTYENLTFGEFAGQDDDELAAAFALGVIPKGLADDIVANPGRYTTVTGDRLAIFQAVAKGQTAATAPASDPTKFANRQAEIDKMFKDYYP